MNTEGIPQQFEVQRKHLSEQVARLQQRQRELVQQTVLLLEEETEAAKKPLQEKIDHLIADIRAREEENHQLTQKITELQEAATRHMQAVDQQLENLFSSMNTGFESLHRSPSSPPAKEASPTKPKKSFTFSKRFTRPKKNLELTPLHLEKPHIPHKHTLRKMASFAVTALLAYAGTQEIVKFLPTTTRAESGAVAGVHTETSPSPQGTTSDQSTSFGEYAESKANVTYQDTTWKETDRPDFGFTMEYPANASNLISTPGGSNLWVLRKDAYLMKFTISDSAVKETLAEWWDRNKDSYSDYSQPTTTTFKGQPALAATSGNGSEGGTVYIIKRSQSVLAIWVSSNPSDSNDGQRITKMLDTLKLTN